MHATGGHYSHVAVTFFDRDAALGDKYLGHEVIPLIDAGHYSTATVDWDTTGLSGTHTVYAKVHYWPRLETRRDNNLATLTVPLGQGTTPTPVVPEWSAFWLFASGLLALGALGVATRRRRPNPPPRG